MSDAMSSSAPSPVSPPAAGTSPPGVDLADAVAAARAALTADAPLVQCLTNVVAATLTANVLLAAGATPAMVDHPDEAGPFAAVASAVLVNVGTPTDATAEAMRRAADGAAAAGTPWVLDPVAVGGPPFRTALAADLLTRRPTVVRGNASEVLAVAGTGVGGRGVDSVAGAEEAVDAARALAGRTGGAVAVSGAADVVLDARHTVRVSGGSALLTRTTGAGCALGALVAAYAAVVPEPLVAALAAHLHVAVAAERAAATNPGPGTFAVRWVDALAAVTPTDLAAVLVEPGRLQ